MSFRLQNNSKIWDREYLLKRLNWLVEKSSQALFAKMFSAEVMQTNFGQALSDKQFYCANFICCTNLSFLNISQYKQPELKTIL